MTTYKDSGVDVEGAEKLVRELKKRFSSVGGYAGVVETGSTRIAATCDGVGTKILLLKKFGLHETAGIDLVAMNVNDLIAGGVKPVFFMDYFACGRLEEDVFLKVINGIETGLKQVGCALLGVETAEMPDMYRDGEYDLAGFSCGVPLKEFDMGSVNRGDIIAGMASSGVHSNGFSLVRKVFNEEEVEKYRDIILAPTRIYSELIIDGKIPSGIKNLAHVTGGGTNRALKRLLPEELSADISLPEPPEVFSLIMERGVKPAEMENVFNMGIGMLMVLDENSADSVCRLTGAKILGKVK